MISVRSIYVQNTRLPLQTQKSPQFFPVTDLRYLTDETSKQEMNMFEL